MSKAILSPLDWLEENPHYLGEPTVTIMGAYADYIAVRAIRNTRHRAAEISMEARSRDDAHRDIMNISTDEVYTKSPGVPEPQ